MADVIAIVFDKLQNSAKKKFDFDSFDKNFEPNRLLSDGDAPSNYALAMVILHFSLGCSETETAKKVIQSLVQSNVFVDYSMMLDFVRDKNVLLSKEIEAFKIVNGLLQEDEDDEAGALKKLAELIPD